MDEGKLKLIEDYFWKVKSASKEFTKKELFKDLLNRLYAGSDDILNIVSKISEGSETAMLNIPRNGRIHRGSADSAFNKVIIEFENDLDKTRKHAKEQLAGYYLSKFHTEGTTDYLLIATDCLKWEVYAPSIQSIEKLETLSEGDLELNEVLSARLHLKPDSFEDFYFWIDRYLFREQTRNATLSSIQEAFGLQSRVFGNCFKIMLSWFQEAKKYGEVQVSEEQWRRFLSIAYGDFKADDAVFVIHTYLSLFAKLLAYSLLTKTETQDEQKLQAVISGEEFTNLQIENFVENDFFHWVKEDRNFRNLLPAIRLINSEISTFDFSVIEEDILKGVYQELIDVDTRHALGEYYTPDWLCDRVVSEYSFKLSDRILDPSCGSGSFLRAAIQKLNKEHPNADANTINACVYGIDIHPLSVQIAKTTVLLSLGKKLDKLSKPLRLNILMANTLMSPKGATSLFGDEFKIMIDRKVVSLNTKILESSEMFDLGLTWCDDMATLHQGKKGYDLEVFRDSYKKALNGGSSTEYQSFFEIYRNLKLVKENQRDTIWKFIISNLYRPFFMFEKFDYVIGNPPWFTFSSVKNEEYQDALEKIANTYDVIPKPKNKPHLEIAAIFLAYCVNFFLKKKREHTTSRLAFVLPRSFFNADQHQNTRSGKVKNLNIEKLWDLDTVSPLFNIPSCVIFADYSESIKLRARAVKGVVFSGRVKKQNVPWSQVNISEEEVTYTLKTQGNSTAFTTAGKQKKTQLNPYKQLFKQGATIVPRTFYFVEFANKEAGKDFKDGRYSVRTDPSILPDAKEPWKKFNDLSSFMKSKFLFHTALAKSILPYCITNLNMVLLPILVSKDETDAKSFKVLSPDELILEGEAEAAKWFTTCETYWEFKKTAKSKPFTSRDWLDYQSKLSKQDLNYRYLVLYNASAKDANAGVLDRTKLPTEFFNESTAYCYPTNNTKEAFYLCSLLNSSSVNALIKPFQASGLFGPRHVHKKVLDVYFPRFSEKNSTHLKIADLSEALAEKVENFVNGKDLKDYQGAMKLGKLRLEIKKEFETEFAVIDEWVEKVL